MSKRFKKVTAFIIVAFVLFSPLLVFAQQGLLPDCNADCTLADFVVLVQNVINFIIFTLAFPISAFMFAVAGIMMMSARGKEEQIKKAKSIFWGVGVGLVIMLAAWIIVYTITNTLLSDEFKRSIPEELELNP